MARERDFTFLHMTLNWMKHVWISKLFLKQFFQGNSSMLVQKDEAAALVRYHKHT